MPDPLSGTSLQTPPGDAGIGPPARRPVEHSLRASSLYTDGVLWYGTLMDNQTAIELGTEVEVTAEYSTYLGQTGRVVEVLEPHFLWGDTFVLEFPDGKVLAFSQDEVLLTEGS